MPNYYYVTNAGVSELGFFVSNSEAEDSAMERFTLSPQSNDWLVLSDEELRKIVSDADKYNNKANH